MNTHQGLLPEINSYSVAAIRQFDGVPAQRRVLLDRLAGYIAEHRNGAMLSFICTHNSRRSQVAQLWAAAAAAYYGIGHVHCFSGGTEATAFHRNAIAALKRMGFKIEMVQPGKNPVYEASWSESAPPMKMFSKKYDDRANPGAGFAAVMVCSHADANCPFVPGVAARVALPYEDPGAHDGTGSEEAMYDKCCMEIAVEMLYAMHRAKEMIAKG